MINKLVTAYLCLMLLCISSIARAAVQSTMLLQSTSVDDLISLSETNEPKDDTQEVSPLTQLGSEFHNSIALLQNRFRIDYEVEELTMVFFRKFGSSPIVLVKPDGSKLFSSSADGESVFWYDTSTYDMISIKNPDIGPWQAVGDILPNSRVMVISELALHAEKLPEIIFSGEILKQTAYLTNDGVPIDYTAFRDVVELTISLSSTNNPNYNNFGAKPAIIAKFQDDGKGMDEVPLDGVFTGQFNLAVADGEWIPSFDVSTPMYSREQIDPPIMLLPNPVKIDVDVDDGTGGYHILKVDTDREHVDISTLLVDGKVRYPNGDIQNFSITDMSDDVRVHEIVHFDFGVYRVKLTAFGNTVGGREFILDVPEFSFLVEEPKPVEPVVDGAEGIEAAEQVETSEPSSEKEDVTVIEEEQGMPTSTLVSLIVGINLFLLIVGGGLIWMIVSGKKIKWAFWKKSQNKDKAISEDTTSASLPKPSLFARLFKRKSKEPDAATEEKKVADKTDGDSGFKDLSIPED